MTTTVKRYNQSVAAAIMQPSDNVSAKGKVISNPTSSDDATIFFTDTEISIHAMQAVLVGSSTPSVTWTVRYAADRSAAGTEVVTGGTTTTGTTSGSAVTTLNNATIPADNFVWLETTAKSGTVAELGVTVIFGTAAAAPGGGGGSYATVEWDTIPATAGGDRDIYLDFTLGVNSATFDATHGSITNPYKDISYGLAQMRTGHGDRLWFKRGETWTNQRIGTWTLSGQSSANPMVFGAYGTGARPIIDTQSSSFFTTNGSDTTVPNYLFFESLNIVSTTYSGGGGVTAIGLYTGTAAGCDYITFQDCRFYNFGGFAVIAQNESAHQADLLGVRHNHLTFRGCHIEDVYTTASGSDSSGMYLQGIDNLTIEWCHADRASLTANSQWANRKHNYYIHNTCQNVVFRYNIDTNGNDTQIRPGGTVHHNVHSKCTWGYEFGLGTFPQAATATGLFEDNCVLDAGVQAATDLTTGLRMGNSNNVSVRRNIFVGSNTTNPMGFWLEAWDGTGAGGLALTGCSLEDNIVHNFGGIGVNCSFGTVGTNWLSNTFKRNYIQNPDNTTPWSGNAEDRVFSFLASMGSATWTMESNVVNRHDGTTALWYIGGAGPYDIPGTEWNAAFADATTSTASVSFSNASGATLGQYYVSLGNTTLGGESADHAAMVSLIKGNTKAAWDDRYTAPAIHAYIVECMTPV